MIKLSPFIVVALCAFALTFVALPAHAGGVAYVDDDAAGGGDGASWATAYRFLQHALTAAAAPGSVIDEIRVGQGTYRPDRDDADPAGSGDREASFVLVSGVALRGGYAGIGAADPDVRDPSATPSVLSGDLAANDAAGLNTGENAYSVITASDADAASVVDGFVITAGNANGPEEGPTHQLRGGGVYSAQGVVNLLDCTVLENTSFKDGGGVWSSGSPTTFVGCTFNGNLSIEGAGGAFATNGPTVTMRQCSFTGNRAAIAGAVQLKQAVARISFCAFHDNRGYLAAGAMNQSLGVSGTISNCSFARNESGSYGGAFYGALASFVNCVFSRNTAVGYDGDGIGGAVGMVYQPGQFINCTMSGNDGASLYLAESATVLSNCIVWGNTPIQMFVDFDADATLHHTDYQGGWTGPGSGNLDVDPLFVQPGTDNVRLAKGSPCIDAGDSGLLPADVNDLDEDGNVTEAVPLDLDALPRVMGSAVDLGAYEGEHEPMAPATSESMEGVDHGQVVILDPSGVVDPYQAALVIFTNLSGSENATVEVTAWETDLYQTAEHYMVGNVTLELETSLAPGEFSATIFIPFAAGDLPGVDPLRVRATESHLLAWARGLAVAGNAADSPGFTGPIGNSLTFIAGQGGTTPTSEPGDYGVSWDPQAQIGYVWANVDHAGAFGFGVPLCPADCRQDPVPNGTVNVDDLVTLLTSWGDQSGHGPCDIDFDGTVGVDDLMALIRDWGGCAPFSPATDAGDGAAQQRLRAEFDAAVRGADDVTKFLRSKGW